MEFDSLSNYLKALPKLLSYKLYKIIDLIKNVFSEHGTLIYQTTHHRAIIRVEYVYIIYLNRNKIVMKFKNVLPSSC